MTEYIEIHAYTPPNGHCAVRRVMCDDQTVINNWRQLVRFNGRVTAEPIGSTGMWSLCLENRREGDFATELLNHENYDHKVFGMLRDLDVPAFKAFGDRDV